MYFAQLSFSEHVALSVLTLGVVANQGMGPKNEPFRETIAFPSFRRVASPTFINPTNPRRAFDDGIEHRLPYP